MRATSTNPKVRYQRLRREALRQGLGLTKTPGQNVWLLWDAPWDQEPKHGDVFRSLDEVESALTKRRLGADTASGAYLP